MNLKMYWNFIVQRQTIAQSTNCSQPQHEMQSILICEHRHSCKGIAEVLLNYIEFSRCHLSAINQRNILLNFPSISEHSYFKKVISRNVWFNFKHFCLFWFTVFSIKQMLSQLYLPSKVSDNLHFYNVKCTRKMGNKINIEIYLFWYKGHRQGCPR